MSESTVPIFDFYETICRLHDLELYDSIIMLYEISYASQMLSRTKAAHVVSMVAESYYERDRFLYSGKLYDFAIMLTEGIPRGNRHPKFQLGELKFRQYRCLMKVGKWDQAINVLNSIAEEDMIPKALSALARLHYSQDDYCSHNKVEAVRIAVSYHKRVVEICPEAIDSLSIVVRFAQQKKYETPSDRTVYVWLKAQEAISQQNYRNAIAFLTQARPGNIKIMVELGRLHFILSEYNMARMHLKRAHQLDPNNFYSMDILAYIFWQDQSKADMRKLANSLMKKQKTPEAWMAFAFFAIFTGKYDRALSFVEKACSFMGWRMNPIAVLAKAFVLIRHKKCDIAMQILHVAIVNHPFNIKLYETFIIACLANGKIQRAMSVASTCRQNLGEDNVRALLLSAYLNINFGSAVEGFDLLMKAIKLAPDLSDTVLMFVDSFCMPAYRQMLRDKQRVMTDSSSKDVVHNTSQTRVGQVSSVCHQLRLQYLTSISGSNKSCFLYQ